MRYALRSLKGRCYGNQFVGRIDENQYTLFSVILLTPHDGLEDHNADEHEISKSWNKHVHNRHDLSQILNIMGDMAWRWPVYIKYKFGELCSSNFGVYEDNLCSEGAKYAIMRIFVSLYVA